VGAHRPSICTLRLFLKPEPGVRPGGRLTFFCFAKRKSAKKRRPHCACPSAALRGNLRCSRRRPAAELAAFTSFTALRQLRQVSPRSTPVLRQACGRRHCAPRHAQRGSNSNAPWRVLVGCKGERRHWACAHAPAQRTKRPGHAQRGRWRPSEAMARPTPLWLRRGAQGRRPARLPKDRRAS
jgi:hypothetical protein